jgi:DNA-binding LacI/PurR family transcriptional regulator/DNA-binding CsgD family transcriptional regulator
MLYNEVMRYYLLKEKIFEETYWCKQYIAGIKEEANRNKIKILENTEIDFSENGIVFLIATTNEFLNKIIEDNVYNKIKIIYIGPQVELGSDYNSIMCDYNFLVKNAIKYCKDNNCNKILLYGVNPNSQGDLFFENTFKEEMLDDGYEFGKEKFDLDKQEALLLILQNYDAILCCNMIIAKSLITQMKKISDKIPWVISLLDSPLGQYCTTDITTFIQNEREIGRQSVRLAISLKKNNNEVKVIWKTIPSIHVGETTDYIDYKISKAFSVQKIEEETNYFLSDKLVLDLLRCENLVANLNDSDFEILKYIGLNYTYSQMATLMNISESNIKYRMKRLEKITKIESRKELLNLLMKNVPKLVNP